MGPVGSSSFAVSNRAPAPGAAPEAGSIIVWPGSTTSEIAPARHPVCVQQAAALKTWAEGADLPVLRIT